MKTKLEVEIVDTGDVGADIVALLRHMLQRARAGELVGVVVLGERVDGAYVAVMSESHNAGERIGRIELLKMAVLRAAVEVTNNGE